MQKLTYVMVWVLVFSIPWKNSVIFLDSLTITKLIGLVAVAVALLAVAVRKRVRKLHLFHYAFGLYLALTAASYLWSVDKGATVQQIVTFAQLAGLLWMIWEFARARERQVGLLRAYVWGAYVAVASTVARYLAGTTSVENAGRYGTAGFNPNDVGGLLVLAIPIAWYLASLEKRAAWRWLYQFYIVAALPAILLTGSRSALVAALVALLIIPFSYLRIRLSRKVATGLIVMAAAYTAMIYVPAETWARLGTIDTEVATGNFGQRGPIWKAGFHLFSEHPILGVGAGGFHTSMIPYFQRVFASHNVYLNVLAELGVVGFAAFAGMVAVAVRPVAKMRGLERTFWIVLLLTLAVVLLPRNWEYRKPLWFVLGLLCAWGATPRRSPARREEQRSPDSAEHAPARPATAGRV